jgi:hypothetical protein
VKRLQNDSLQDQELQGSTERRSGLLRAHIDFDIEFDTIEPVLSSVLLGCEYRRSPPAYRGMLSLPAPPAASRVVECGTRARF